MRHELNSMPKESVMVRFPSLPNQMCGIHLNKEIFSVDVIDNAPAG